MKRVRQCIAAVAITLWAGGCEWVLGIEDGKLRPEKPAPDCIEAIDCKVDEPACRSAASCNEGKCVYQDAPEGTPLPGDRQMVGDCLELVCDGVGKSKLIQSETDVDDGNPCTVDACNGSTPEHPLQTQVPCYSGPVGTMGVGVCHGGIQQCDATGNSTGGCVGETLPAELDGCDTEVGVDDDCDGQADEDCYCGNGKLEPLIGEECDDGGTADGDPCSPSCKEQRALAICAGTQHTCALLSGGAVKCWGRNDYGELGSGDTKFRGNEPGEMGAALPSVDLGTGRHAVAIASGFNHNCALLDNQTIKCWGWNQFGQLGLGDTQNRGDEPGELGDALPAITLGTGSIPIAIDAGYAHTCVLLNDGSVKCWGTNGGGQLGLGDVLARGDELGEMGDALKPVDLGSGQFAKAIAAGVSSSCALLEGGMVKCWGYNVQGALGLGDTMTRGDSVGEMGNDLAFVELGTGKVATAISSFYGPTCVRLSDGAAKCWGSNGSGVLGLGDVNARGDDPGEMGNALPAVDLGTNVMAVQVKTSFSHSCALLDDGQVKCWGQGILLGLGDTMTRGDNPSEMGDALPVVELGLPATAIVAGCFHTCALLVNGSAKCWGINNNGQLGLGDTNDRGDEPGEMGDNLPTVKLFSDEW